MLSAPRAVCLTVPGESAAKAQSQGRDATMVAPGEVAGVGLRGERLDRSSLPSAAAEAAGEPELRCSD